MVVITAKNENGFFKISVIDNGSGMDITKLSRIRKSLNETGNDLEKRIGLKNVHQRIKLHYGDDYGLEILSEPGKGTQVDILLPEKG
jgi:two-component system sensor histidine kinase YesM